MNPTDKSEVRQFFQSFARSFMKVSVKGVEKWHVTAVQGHILNALAKQPQASLNQLAGLLNFEKSFISKQVEQLVKMSMVERLPDPIDRRYVRISLTPEGMRKQEEITEFMEQYIQDLMDGIPATKRKQVVESLSLMMSSLRNYLGREKGDKTDEND